VVLQRPLIRVGLYLVATPIGTASDISLRALDLIRNANVLIAEDTRTLRKLMKIHDIKLDGRTLISYHDHNGEEQRPKILAFIKNQNSVVLVSDAGTPLIADPGYQLVKEVISAGYYLSGIPGASAVLSALVVSGLPTDKFFFGGFVPIKEHAKEIFFSQHLDSASTLVVYESPSRLVKTLHALCEIYEKTRKIAVCRELTKKFEDIQRGNLETVAAHFSSQERVKGEIVLVIAPAKPKNFGDKEIEKNLMAAFDYMSFKDSISFVAKNLKVSKKIVYAKALKIARI
jgi:16S rRNA (cytidine1402-2'-O)-methyltransferase